MRHLQYVVIIQYTLPKMISEEVMQLLKVAIIQLKDNAATVYSDTSSFLYYLPSTFPPTILYILDVLGTYTSAELVKHPIV